MKDDPTYPRKDWEAHIFTHAYQGLAQAGDACRILCQEHPDLLDSIAKAIMNFLYDGDVFDQVARTMLASEPSYWAARLSELEVDEAKAIIGPTLDPEDGFVIIEGAEAEALRKRFDQALSTGSGPFHWPTKNDTKE